MAVKIVQYLLLLISTHFGILNAVASGDKLEITIVSDEWQGFVNRQGKGYYLDILNQVFPRTDYNIQLNILPYARALNQVQYDRADIVLGIWANEHPINQISYYPVEIDLLDAAFPIEYLASDKSINIKSFNHLRVLSRVGYQIDELLDQPKDYAEYVEIDRMLRMVASNRADVLIDYRTAIEPVMETLGLGNELGIIDNVLTEYVYFGFCSSDKCHALRQRFDEKYLELYHQGAIKQFIIDNQQKLDVFPPLISIEEVLSQ